MNLIATGGDCDDTNNLLNTSTTRYLDTDSDGFSAGTTTGTCTTPGATRHLDYELLHARQAYGYSGLVAYRDFDTGSVIDKVGTNHGTVYSLISTAVNTMGTIGRALELNTGTIVKVADSAALDVSYLTMSAWIYRTTDCPANGDTCMIYNKENAYER